MQALATADTNFHVSMDYIYVAAIVAMKNKCCFDFITLLKNSPSFRKNCDIGTETSGVMAMGPVPIVAREAEVKRYVPKCRQENVQMYYFDKVWHYGCHGS